MRVRRAAKGVGDFVVESIGEAVAEVVLGVLACALLAGLALIAYLSWSFSPLLTVAGTGLLSLFLAHGAWGTFRDPVEGRRRRGWTAVAAVCFTLVAATAAFLLLYASDCGCL
ncbi:lysine transporter LysE [Streptomyces sp. QL37]|uniref:lysine transporter LysE n=1 Tax=Streptomyces sp. QL37 TaxID=2093747 RepID=UPI000CF2BC6C|nr:lysine transporter LysE [Streptomyces sp. QL37]PPQ56165.1 lysine transporter LysE [Streptomyces sp. QL37]